MHWAYSDRIGVFPAYVGMSPKENTMKKSLKGVPRIRGDEPDLMARQHLWQECSPHTWG